MSAAASAAAPACVERSMPAGTGSSAFPIDAVFLWVDGADPSWRRSKEALREKLFGEALPSREADNASLFKDNDELRFALRSLAVHAPWIRTVHLVTDGQRPSWLNTEAVNLVSHSTIFPDGARLPVFNSQAIEWCMHRVPGLAEHFLAFNDDFLFARAVTPGDFFLPDGSPRLWLARRGQAAMAKLRKRAGGENPHASAVARSHLLVEARYGSRYPYVIRHYPRAMTRSTVEELWRVFPEEIDATVRSAFRTSGEILLPMVYPLYMLAQGKGNVRVVNGARQVMDVFSGGMAYIGASMGDANLGRKMRSILRYRPKTFCLNDSVHATDGQRSAVRAFLASMFPEQCVFETREEQPRS